MRYEVLGTLRVLDGDREFLINARKVQILLAALLSRPGEVVTTDQLITEIWGQKAPRRAEASLYVHVSQLRKSLDRPGGPANPIVTRPLGYLLDSPAEEQDATEFHRLLDDGRQALRELRLQEAVISCEAALALWRGPALDELPVGPIAGAYASSLTESRLECTELLMEAYCELGRHREIVGRLYSLVAENPLRESLYRYLMRALYLSERKADALEVYRKARATLRDEVGVEPGRRLQAMHQAILADSRVAM
ncbi:AfsR/SARP family transcriptional regulator [Streptomyces litchfieldiae]|uniref:AfsR/SARP family transcriptional regulator n=1 Tax=Streptomyces litchfieldiae TaxID=3075543 RepID=A0ABU2N098_9ACTN|nr:AfsR/SARP family transcriptional regulator [Streptomyces sp. DSM 44938]MDT0347327.1 AfsR/SARP family transcriptional regulator [Streptomyces sp. DSM 44938]